MGIGAFGVHLPIVHAADDTLATVGDATGLGNEDPKIIVGNIIRYALGFIGIVLVCFMVYGGFVWMTASGNPEKVDKAKKILINAVIGLVIILMSWAITSFVITSILGSTGGSSGSGGGGGGSGTGSGLGGGSSSAFEVTGFSPEGTTSIRNIQVRVTLSKTVDEATVDGNVVISDASGTAVAGTYTTSGNTVKFVPSAACPDPNSDRFCFDENATYTITVGESLQSSGGSTVECSDESPCTTTFTAGSLIDTEDPSVDLTVPESGDSVSIDSTMDVQAHATDDAGVSAADFSVEDEWQDSIDGAQTTDETLETTLSTSGFVSGERYSVSVTVTDLAGNEDSDSVSVRARPAWCFNGVEDADLGEEGVDCGGDSSSANYCGACEGSSCTEDADCSSGTCTDGVCVSVPTISDVSPTSGAAGTYVTISGTAFGANTGTVLFTDEAGTGTVEATVLRDCADGWSSDQIVVEVPEGAGDGPISIITGDDVTDTTDDDNGASVENFDVNEVVTPNLCSLSDYSGQSTQALTLSGSNFGNAQGASTVNFSSTDAGSYTSWADGTVKVTVPNADAGQYDVSITVGDVTSNTISYTIVAPESDVSTITEISPSSGGIGQYVTISGTNFGIRTGTVTFEGSDGNTATASIDFPEACDGHFWNDDEVTVIVPESFDNGDAMVAGSYTVYVTNTDGTESTSTSFTVTSSDPTPGICAITESGDVGEVITISGDNFGGDVDTVTFATNVTSITASTWTNDSIDVAVPTGAITGPVTVTVAGVTSNRVNFMVGDAGAVASTSVSAEYAWAFSTGEILEVPAVVSECNGDTVSAVPNNEFSESTEICVNAVVYAEFTTLMDNASVEGALSVEKCTAAVSSPTDDPCATTEAVSGTATAADSISATRLTWVPTSNFDTSSTYRVTISTAAVSTDDIALAENETWEFTTSTSDADCVVDRVTVTPSNDSIAEQGDTTGFGANAGTGCVVVDSSDYTWDWSIDSYSYVDFNSSVDAECVGDPTSCATFEAYAEGTTVVTATALNVDGAGNVDDDAELIVNFSDPYIVDYEPACTEACMNAEIGASFNTTMTITDIQNDGNIVLYECGNELCTTLTQIDENPACVFQDASGTECVGFEFGEESLTAGAFYRVVVSGDITSTSHVALIRTNYGSDYSWTFRVREDGTLCAVERIELGPENAEASAIGELGSFTVDAFGEADSCSTSGQQLVASSLSWQWTETSSTSSTHSIPDDTQNRSTDYATAAWYTVSDALLDGGTSGIVSGCSASCTPIGSSEDQAVCGNDILEANADGGGEECDDGNTTDHDGCSSTCLNEGSSQCAFTCSSTGDSCTVDSQCTETCDASSSTCTLSGTTCTTDSDCPYVSATCRTTAASCCGNADVEVDYSADFAEDCDDGNLTDGDGCSSSCLAEGSASVGATCGNSDVAYDPTTLAGEECDDGNNASGDGCSRACLSEGSQNTGTLGDALCGDGEITDPYESCDDGNAVDDGNGCSETCVRTGLSACTETVTTNCCGNGTVDVDTVTGAGEDCDGQEGCSEECIYEGSSTDYSEPSVCGDGDVGFGEYLTCELASGSGDGKPDPIQVAYITEDAASEVSESTNLALATVTVTESSSLLSDSVSWALSCTAETDTDCSDPETMAVGTSNCCVTRPSVVSLIPAGAEVCRNAAITATFDREMDTSSFVQSSTETLTGGGTETTETTQMYLVLNLAANQTCPTGYTTSSYLAMTWFERAVSVLRTFIFGPIAEAAASSDCVLPVRSYTQTAMEDGTYKVALNYDTALEADSSYTLVILGDTDTSDETSEGVRSALGAAMNGGESLTFTTGSDICTLDDVIVTDTDADSPNVFTTEAESHAFAATAMSYRGVTAQEIVGIADVYDWSWSTWDGSDDGIVTVAQDSSALDTATVTAAGDNGEASVSVTAMITTDKDGGTAGSMISGSERVTAYLCENTWPDLASFPWSDDATGAANGLAAAGTNGYMNFSLGYCQDYGTDNDTEDDLPDVTPVLAPVTGASDVLKEYLFEIDATSTSTGAESSGDAIGVRVLSNPDHLSPLAWYEEKGFSGSPAETTVDGFQAITDERSTYIAVANASTASGLYSNIIVISYNEGASDITEDIYNQMVSNLSFLLNMASDGVCSASGNACTVDADCDPENDDVCLSDKMKITRDTARLGDLKDIAIAVDAYGEENRTCSETTSQTCSEDSDCPEDETCEAVVPTLASGTAVRAMASSAWGSWTSSLAGALDADELPTDPWNHYEACSGYDAATCVNTTDGSYLCPTGSHVYHYRALGTRSYGLALDLEYTTLSWVDDIEDDSDDTVTYSKSGFCDNDVYGTSSSCGDGVIGATETCEIGDLQAMDCTTAEGDPGTENETCNSSCTGWTALTGAVCSAGTCGDGVVDTSLGEDCDDGSLNGDYGYCDATCHYTDAEYCGDGVISGGEACDCGDTSAEVATGKPYGGAYGTCSATNGTYGTAGATTCAWDCAGPAAYCGDGTIDELNGEVCDGNTVVSADGLCLNQVDALLSTFDFCASDADCTAADEVCELTDHWYGACDMEHVCTAGDAEYIGAICTSDANCGTDGVCAANTVQTYRTKTCDSSCALTFSSLVCTATSSCGDGTTDANEECDDGNDVSTDSCTTECTLNVCGDAYIYDGEEECDEGVGNGGGCSSAYGSTCTACSITCHYTTSSGEFCGDGVTNGDEYCDGADTPYVWFDQDTMTTNGTCSTEDATWADGSITYTCRSVGFCNGGDENGEYCTGSTGISGVDGVTDDMAFCRMNDAYDGECVMPVCGADCEASCPTSTSTTTLLMTSNQPGATAANDVDLYSYDSSSTSDIPNAATITIPACTVAGNLLADVDFSNVDPPDVYVVFVTDTSGSMGWEFGASSSDGDAIDERLDVAQTSLVSAVGELFDELGTKMHIGLVHYSSTIVTDTSTFLGESSESTLTTYINSYAASGSTYTDDGLDAAKTLLDTVTDVTNVAKIIVHLSDGEPSSGHDPDSVAYSILSDDIEMYSIALTNSTLADSMNDWSSNSECEDTDTSLSSCDTGNEYNPSNLIDYSYIGDTSAEVSDAYDAIIDSIINGTAVLISSNDGDVTVDRGSVSDLHNIELPWPSNFECDGVTEQEVPIQITFRGEPVDDSYPPLNVSNIRIDYCSP